METPNPHTLTQELSDDDDLLLAAVAARGDTLDAPNAEAVDAEEEGEEEEEREGEGEGEDAEVDSRGATPDAGSHAAAGKPGLSKSKSKKPSKKVLRSPSSPRERFASQQVVQVVQVVTHNADTLKLAKYEMYGVVARVFQVETQQVHSEWP